VSRFRGCALRLRGCYACWGAGFGGVLEDGNKELYEEGGGEGSDAGAGYGALLVEGGVTEGLVECGLVGGLRGRGWRDLRLRARRRRCRSSSRARLRLLGWF
jgi:hypothetical protein